MSSASNMNGVSLTPAGVALLKNRMIDIAREVDKISDEHLARLANVNTEVVHLYRKNPKSVTVQDSKKIEDAEVKASKKWTKPVLATISGISKDTIDRMFDCERIRVNSIESVASALRVDPGDLVDPSDRRKFSKIVDLSQDTEPKRNDEQQARSLFAHPFQTIIDNKTKDFVGREYVFTEIKKFINSKTNGYFTIIGDPGMGKSTILAKYVHDTGCVAHFNVEQDGENRPDQFLESVCKQLIKQYQLPYSLPLPADAKSDGVFLKNLLDEVAIKRNGKPVVIAVDALDEVDLSSQTNKNANILYLPRYLPKGIYFVTTIRRGVKVPLMTDAPQQIFNLIDYQDQSREDICTYIQNRVNGSQQLRQWIKNQDVTEENFIDELATKSENNFMYLVHVLQDIEDRKYTDLNLTNLPKGLEKYYEFHWQRKGLNDKPRSNVKMKVVYHLATSRQPISCQLISKYTGETPLRVQDVLHEWLQFLHERPIEGEVCYSIYHRSYWEFLHNDERVKAAGVSLKEINKEKSDYLWKGLFGDE